MKRLILGLVTLAIVLVGTWWNISMLTSNAEALITELEDIEAAFYAGQQAQCLTLCEQFPEAVKRHTQYLPITLTHGELHSLEELAACLPVLYAQKDMGAFVQELARCKQQLRQLRDAEMPTFGNIL